MTRFKEVLSQAPYTLWIFSVVTIIWGVVASLVLGTWIAWGTLGLDLVFAGLLLSRVRWAWILLIVGAAFGAVSLLIASSWWLALLNLVLLGLLLSPSTRKFMAG